MRQTKYCRVPIKQRLFSFNFTFQLSHYSILSFSPLLSSELDFVSRTNRKLFLSVLDMMAAFTLSQAYRQPEVFYVRFRECHFESGLAEVIYIDFGHSSTLDSFFSKTEVIYVSFSLYCKTRLFTFNFLNLQITQTLHGIS